MKSKFCLKRHPIQFHEILFCISALGICCNLHRLLLTMQCMVMDNSIQLQCNFNLLYSRLISDWSVFQISCLQIRHWRHSLKSSRSGGIWWWNSKILRKNFIDLDWYFIMYLMLYFYHALWKYKINILKRRCSEPTFTNCPIWPTYKLIELKVAKK